MLASALICLMPSKERNPQKTVITMVNDWQNGGPRECLGCILFLLEIFSICVNWLCIGLLLAHCKIMHPHHKWKWFVFHHLSKPHGNVDTDIPIKRNLKCRCDIFFHSLELHIKCGQEFGKRKGPTGSRTQVAGFKVQSANHYTIEPYTVCSVYTFYLF